MPGSWVDRVRKEMIHMLGSFDRDNPERWCELARGWVPQLERARAAKTAPKRPNRRPEEIIQNDERALHAIIQFHPAKSNIEIGNHLGCDGGRVSECMRAAHADGRASFADGLKHLSEVLRPALERGDKLPYLRWQRAKKT